MIDRADPRSPAWVERAPTYLGGHSTDRIIFIFRAVGCSYARRPEGGCTNCGFFAMTLPPEHIMSEDLIAQFDSVFSGPEAVTGVEEVDLYNSGSFFADEEMPDNVRTHVYQRLGKLPLSRVLLESRPEFITTERVREARQLLGSVALEVGIGLESANDKVREQFIRKGFDLPAFERAAAVLAEAGAGMLTNVLLKPLGLEEAAAVDDAAATGKYIFDLARRLGLPTRVALQPVFVPPGTPLEKEFLAGRYSPPSLWSVVEVVRQLHSRGETVVGLSEEGLGPQRSPAGCGKCDQALRQALRDYNRKRTLDVFSGLTCSCR